ncbi:hypothetical protein DAPPUDRAFT_307943 [Daphnia pulex]|uniref:Uncharacterized protein n=1 Tax=Daphnia pulex TaxID=6669 RepID=E9H516_DAPPU|nr:hypothetical protein DAPPUDRAFT_307943 [Daphnia pulex]|eukprot:EFX73261.1 hypothetical protein DAPPUDRAFT_307943 [Daphnia pulex]
MKTFVTAVILLAMLSICSVTGDGIYPPVGYYPGASGASQLYQFRLQPISGLPSYLYLPSASAYHGNAGYYHGPAAARREYHQRPRSIMSRFHPKQYFKFFKNL